MFVCSQCSAPNVVIKSFALVRTYSTDERKEDLRKFIINVSSKYMVKMQEKEFENNCLKYTL